MPERQVSRKGWNLKEELQDAALNKQVGDIPPSRRCLADVVEEEARATLLECSFI
jgi:hypothetical protein